MVSRGEGAFFGGQRGEMEMKTLFSVGPGVFTDEEFASAVGELASPELDGWEFFVETMGTKIYRKYREVCVFVCGCSNQLSLSHLRILVYMSTRRLVRWLI